MSSAILDEVQFILVKPEEGDPNFDPQNPALVAHDLTFVHLMTLLAVRDYLDKHGVCGDDLTRRFNVDPESLHELDSEPYPLRSWWHTLVTMSRADQTDEEAVQEAEDWWRIVSTVLAFHTLHKHKEGYNLPIPKMINMYMNQAVRQEEGDDDVKVVHPDQITEFVAWMTEYVVALTCRLAALTRAVEDTKGFPDYLSITGDIAAASNAAWEAARGTE